FFVGRERKAVRVWYVVDDQAHLAVPDHVDTLELQSFARIFLAHAQAAVRVGEVDRPVFLNDNVVGAVELFAFVAIGEYRARAVFFDTVDRPAGPRRDDEPALRIEREPVRADHVELLECRIARILAVRLLESHAPD